MATCAVPLLHGEGEATVAAALEAADGVPAVAVGAQALKDLTLVHIWPHRHSIAQHISIARRDVHSY